MATLKGAGLSLSLSGSLGKTVTYKATKGRVIGQRYTVPPNEPSPAQFLIRQAYVFLHGSFVRLTSRQVNNATWTGDLRKTTGWAEWVRLNLNLVRGQVNLGTMLPICAPLGFIGVQAQVLTAISGGWTCTPNYLPVPRGYTSLHPTVFYCQDQSPQSPFTGQWHSLNNATPPYTVTVTGLASGSRWYVGSTSTYTDKAGNVKASMGVGGIVTAL